MLAQCDLTQLTTTYLVGLAPFVSSEWLDRASGRTADIGLRHLPGLAPYLGREKLMELVDRLDGPLTLHQLEGIAPFLPASKCAELFQNRLDPQERVDMRHLAMLAPFLDSEVLERTAASLQPASLDELKELAPFLTRECLNRMERA